jgi:hypothetical protein
VKGFDLFNMEDVPIPSGEVAPIEGLTIYNGFMCTVVDCDYLQGTLNSIQKHCQVKHGWIKSKGE